MGTPRDVQLQSVALERAECPENQFPSEGETWERSQLRCRNSCGVRTLMSRVSGAEGSYTISTVTSPSAFSAKLNQVKHHA
jgi:hypothetical protein